MGFLNEKFNFSCGFLVHILSEHNIKSEQRSVELSNVWMTQSSLGTENSNDFHSPNFLEETQIKYDHSEENNESTTDVTHFEINSIDKSHCDDIDTEIEEQIKR